MKVVPAKIEHLELLDFRDQELNTFQLDESAFQKCKALIDISMAGTLVKDGIVLAVFGYYELWPGVFEIWSFPSKHVVKHPVTYLKTLKQYLKQIITSFAPHRVQSTAINDDLHDNWMGFLGFEKCGILRKYTADKVDYAMWQLIDGRIIKRKKKRHKK